MSEQAKQIIKKAIKKIFNYEFEELTTTADYLELLKISKRALAILFMECQTDDRAVRISRSQLFRRIFAIIDHHSIVLLVAFLRRIDFLNILQGVKSGRILIALDIFCQISALNHFYTGMYELSDDLLHIAFSEIPFIHIATVTQRTIQQRDFFHTSFFLSKSVFPKRNGA